MIGDLDTSALYLTGDEDGGAGLNCRRCDRAGLPLAYYDTAGSNPYADQGVVACQTVDQLLHQMRVHVRVAHR